MNEDDAVLLAVFRRFLTDDEPYVGSYDHYKEEGEPQVSTLILSGNISVSAEELAVVMRVHRGADRESL